VLQYHVNVLMDSHTAGDPPPAANGGRRRRRQEAPERSFATALNGKAGAFRNALQGKRVDFSARTVITPDPRVGFGCIGVPHEMAEVLSVPVRVTPDNRAELVRECHEALNDTRHGAMRSLTRSLDGAVRVLSGRDNSDIVHLELGDTVERRLRNGDTVVYNRQPSLHAQSMMGARVRLLPGKTFRLDLSHTTPLNADFDGDEINVHVPQHEQARAEVTALLSTEHVLLHAQKNGACMGLVQDAKLGASLLSDADALYERADFMQLCTAAELQHASCLPIPALWSREHGARWTGRQLLSMALDSAISIGSATARLGAASERSGEWEPPPLYIDRGTLLTGVIRRGAAGVGRGSVFHALCSALNATPGMQPAERAARIRAQFDRLNRLCVEAVTLDGFSVGIGDLFLGACRPQPPLPAVFAYTRAGREDTAHIRKLTEAVAPAVERLIHAYEAWRSRTLS